MMNFRAGPLRLAAVYTFRIETCCIAVVRKLRNPVLQHHCPVEAGTPSGVTGCVVARDFYLQPQGVLVAVGADLGDVLHVARGFALLPKALARARPVMGVFSSASAFMCATISSAPSPASVTIAVMRPSRSRRGEKAVPSSSSALSFEGTGNCMKSPIGVRCRCQRAASS
jgi:hypothetical protein